MRWLAIGLAACGVDWQPWAVAVGSSGSWGGFELYGTGFVVASARVVTCGRLAAPPDRPSLISLAVARVKVS
jgi:hypothetical protein